MKKIVISFVVCFLLVFCPLTSLFAAASLPSSVDWTNCLPTPMAQQQNDCTACASAYALMTMEQKIRRGWTLDDGAGDTKIFSPSYTFNKQNWSNGTGAISLIMMSSYVSDGACPKSYFPYTTNTSIMPTDIQNAAASLYKASGEYLVAGISQMKTRLANGEGIIISFRLYQDFLKMSAVNNVYDSYDYLPNGGTPNTSYGSTYHTVCLIGYDDNAYGGAFKFINSYGSSWVEGGYGWVTYNWLPTACAMKVGNIPLGIRTPVLSTDDYILGDINEDGSVTAADARLALRYSVGLETPTARQYVLADVNGDSYVNSTDAWAINQFATGLIKTMPLYD